MSANFGPSDPWPVIWPCTELVSTQSAPATGAAVAFATAVLWAATGQRFGLTEVTLRPCRRECRPTPYPGAVWDSWPGTSSLPGGSWAAAPVVPYGGLGLVVGAGCWGCGPGCSCTSLSEVVLPAPVNEILEVKVDGVTLSGSAYRPYDNRVLIRADGGTWPYCQDLTLDDTQPGTFSVRASYGEDVPASAAGPIGELACEFLRALTGADCALPTNIASLARQGVTITMPDTTAMLSAGQFGLRLVDLFVQAFNPHRLTARPQTYDVDSMLARRPS